MHNRAKIRAGLLLVLCGSVGVLGYVMMRPVTYTAPSSPLVHTTPQESAPTPPHPRVLAATSSTETSASSEFFTTTETQRAPYTTESTDTSIEQVTLQDVRRALDERLIVYLTSLANVLIAFQSAEQHSASTEEAHSEPRVRGSRSNYSNVLDTIQEDIDALEAGGTSLSDGASLTSITANALLFSNGSAQLSASPSLSFTDGRLGVGTSSASDLLAIAGPVYLDSTIPTTTTNRLYNTGGDLYWNGSILGSSTAATWSTGSGNAYRLTGNIGVGTSSPSDTLTVVGTFSAGTTTSKILDTGGAVCNVVAYGAVGDNTTDNYAAIMAAINDCPEGGTIFFPMGQYRISQTIVLDRPVTLMGTYAPRWSYSSTPRSSIRAAFGSFVGNSIIHVRDRTISGEAADNNGGRIVNLSIDGGSTGTGVEGIYFEGLVRDWKITDVDISQTTGNGFESAVGSGSGNPRGFTIRGLSIYSADGHGFRATALNDSYLEDVLTVGNALRGFYLSSMGETKINNARAAFNALEGLYIDGSTNNGGLQFTDFSTDRNDRHGVRISSTGTTTISFNGLLTRRDGANDGGGTETPYAGVAIIGTTTSKAAPVFIQNLTQIIGVDDDGLGTLAPTVGVRATNATYVRVDGQLWGTTDAYQDNGGNGYFIIAEDSIIKTGSNWSGITPPLFNNKWIASTTTNTLSYNGPIHIGSSTSNRLLNIVAPSNAGARFLDTTNNVTFDMRAEDFQAFFGTFSNHQLRFQTNNASRLTIDIDGDVGIGTTSPNDRLTIVGGGLTVRETDDGNNAIRLVPGSSTGGIELYNNGSRLVNITSGASVGSYFNAGNIAIGTTTAYARLSVWGSAISSGDAFRVVNSASTTRFVVQNGGNIGIGTSSPTAQLHTTGTVRLSNFGAGTLQTDASGNVSVSSDERLKDVLGAYTAGLNEILSIEPIVYKWNEESGFDMETLYAGFSAQNIETALPEAVGVDPHGFLTLSDRPILAAVITALKEIWATVTGNTEKIAELEARIENLEAELNIDIPELPTVPPPTIDGPESNLEEETHASSSEVGSETEAADTQPDDQVETKDVSPTEETPPPIPEEPEPVEETSSLSTPPDQP